MYLFDRVGGPGGENDADDDDGVCTAARLD